MAFQSLAVLFPLILKNSSKFCVPVASVVNIFFRKFRQDFLKHLQDFLHFFPGPDGHAHAVAQPIFVIITVRILRRKRASKNPSLPFRGGCKKEIRAGGNHPISPSLCLVKNHSGYLPLLDFFPEIFLILQGGG
jgi:hypothetical protein